MKLRSLLHISLSFFICVLLLALTAAAGYFGKNKLQTRALHWQVFETDHFEIHYYPEEETLAREVCEIAEAAYQHGTRLMREKPLLKTPLFIYRNQIDFQQTNILPHVIGVGTGGFTEAYKNRVALPAPDSKEKLRQVIFHEFIHVLQFNILYGEGLRSFRVYKGYLIPLWIIEGYAEYGAQDWDSIGAMVVRDAVLNDRLIPLTLMEGFNHLDDTYLAYKESQLAVQYLADRFGEDKLSAIFKKFKSQISISQILRETIGLGLREFNHDFLFWVKQKYWVQANKRETPADFATPLNSAPTGRSSMDTGAVWSPDGRYLAFVSNRDQVTRVYLKPRGQGTRAYAVTTKKYENFSLRGRALAWSPDAKHLAFVAREEGKDHLYLLSVKNRKIQRLDLPIDTFFSPAWSPDGKQIALSGVNNGFGDIYLYTLTTHSLQPLTNDTFADDAPAWSPDGLAIVYSSERETHWQLIWKSMENPNEAPVPLTSRPTEHKTPVFSPDGNYLYYAGDSNAIFNLYRMDLATSEAVQLTDVRIGVFQPAPSPDGKKLAFAAYSDGNYLMFSMPTRPRSNEKEITLSEAVVAGFIKNPSLPISEEEILKDGVRDEKLKITVAQEITTKTAQSVIRDERPYEFRFSPDLLFLLAGYDSSQGIVGGGYITASDYLGNHLVSLISDIVPGYQASTRLSYANLSYPVDIITAIYYRRNYYRILDLETNDLLDEFNDEEVGGALGFVRPFTHYDRVETAFGLSYLPRQHEEERQYRRIPTLRISLIHDSTAWWDYAPTNGFRHNLSLIWADRIFGGEENYTLFQVNAQAYKSLDFINPSLNFSSRLLVAASLGPEHPVFLFGGIGLLPDSVTIRGYRYGKLLGSQVAVCNFEFRFPIAQNINYTLWPLDFLLLKSIQMVLYDDIGVVSNNFMESSLADIRNSVGLGLRLHTFLLGKELLTIRFDVSQRTDTSAETVYVWGLGQSF